MKDFFEGMKLKTTLKRIYLPVLLGTILLSVSFRIAAFFVNYNIDTGFFDGKALINIASVIVIAGSVFMFTYAFSGSKKQKLIADFSTPATYVPTGALSVAMIFFAVLTRVKLQQANFSIFKFLSNIREIATNPVYTSDVLSKYISQNMSNIVLAIIVPMACLSVGYFILTACVLKRGSVLRGFFGTANVLFLAFYTSYLYFDTASSLARNAPNKIVDQMAFLFAALFFLYEIRISLGREKWNLYMAFGFIAASLTAYSSIPSLAFYLINGETVSNSPEENVLTFALFIFILSRISLAISLKEDKESESVTLMKTFARERTDYIKEKEEAAKKAYAELYEELNEASNVSDDENGEAVQITFDDSINPQERISSEYIESDFIIADAQYESDGEINYISDSAIEFIQESITFPVDEAPKADVSITETEEPASEVTADSDIATEESNVYITEVSGETEISITSTEAKESEADAIEENGATFTENAEITAEASEESKNANEDTDQERTI